MEQEDLIRRLKGLGKGSAPAAPDFTNATQSIPTITPVASRAGRLGVAPIAAAVAVLALATAGLALPKGGPLRQALASNDTTETTEVVDEASEADDAPVVPDPCETMPVEAGAGGDAEVATEEELAAREQRAEAWAEWRAENCSDPITAGQDDDDADDDDADDSGKEARDKEARNQGQNSGQDKACTGPPPHANNGDSDRTAAEREAEKREWQEWHRQNCTGADDDDSDDDDEAKAQGSGHDKAKGQGHGPGDANHQNKGQGPDGDDDSDEDDDEGDDD